MALAMPACFLQCPRAGDNTCGCPAQPSPLPPPTQGAITIERYQQASHNIWATQGGRVPLHSGAQAQAQTCWGVGWGILGLSLTPQQRAELAPELLLLRAVGCPAPFISVLSPSALPKSTANPSLQAGKLRLSEASSCG